MNLTDLIDAWNRVKDANRALVLVKHEGRLHTFGHDAEWLHSQFGLPVSLLGEFDTAHTSIQACDLDVVLRGLLREGFAVVIRESS